MDFIDKKYEKLLKKTFNCREQWMMAIKALVFTKGEHYNNNLAVFKEIMNTNNPKKMRTLGRKVKGYDDTTWQNIRYRVVVNGNYLQFSQDNELRDILLNTKDREIVEAAWYDKIWGIGYAEKNARKVGKKVWEKNGLNLLGKALMETRSKFT
jgi:ribA/ribD-fused uncharacterized protein